MDLLLHLRGLVAVADELSVSRAAERLSVDQPLLSRRLRALERHLDVDLLDRSRRQIDLTPAANDLLPRARQLLAQADSLVGAARGPGVAGPFTLTVPPEVDPVALVAVTDLLHDNGIDVELTGPAEGSGVSPSGWQVRPCDPAEATWRTPLGVASAGSGSPAAGLARREGGPARLVDLRPRRGDDGPPLVVTEQDTRAPWWRHVRTALDRAGFSPRHVRQQPGHVAAARALSGQALLLASAAEAARLGLRWDEIAHAATRRGHLLVEQGPVPGPLRTGPLRDAVVHVLGRAVGAP